MVILTPYQMASEFHRIFDDRAPKQPTAFNLQEAIFRQGFKIEEIIELLYATSRDEQMFEQSVAAMHQAIEKSREKLLAKGEPINESDEEILVNQVDALVDLLYFVYGSFVLLGVDPDPMLKIVHQANMGKLFPDGQPHYDEITHKVLKPCILLYLINKSCKAASRACPMCNFPVTFGGGITIVYDFFVLSILGLKYPFFSHSLYKLSSKSFGLYFSANL